MKTICLISSTLFHRYKHYRSHLRCRIKFYSSSNHSEYSHKHTWPKNMWSNFHLRAEEVFRKMFCPFLKHQPNNKPLRFSFCIRIARRKHCGPLTEAANMPDNPPQGTRHVHTSSRCCQIVANIWASMIRQCGKTSIRSPSWKSGEGL